MTNETYSYINLSHNSSDNQEYNCEDNTLTHLEMLVHEWKHKKQKKNKKKKERNSREITSEKKKGKNTENLIESGITGAEEQLFKTLEGREKQKQELAGKFGLVKSGFSNPEIRARTKKA